MRKQILSRAFYGWLAYHRHLKTVSKHLTGLINIEEERLDKDPIDDENSEYEIDENNLKINIGKFYLIKKMKLDDRLFSKWLIEKNETTCILKNKSYFYRIVYLNGIEGNIRKIVWPFLLEHYDLEMNKEQRDAKDKETNCNYYKIIEEWKPFEEHINSRDQKKLAASLNSKAQKLNNETNFQGVQTDKTNEQDNQIIKDAQSIFTTTSSTTTTNNNKSKSSTIKTSLFGFSILKQKPKPLVTSDEKSSDNYEDKKKRLRKESSISNEVFMENDSTFSFSLSKFSAKNLFSKLLSRNLEDENTSLNSANLNENDEYREMAIEIVNQILTKIQNDWENLEKKNLNECRDECEDTLKSESVYVDSRNVFSNMTSIDEAFHDVETGDLDQIIPEKTIENVPKSRANTCSKTSKTSLRSIGSSKQNSLKRTLSNQELIETFALNMHRIDKDVTRCDRNYYYFTSDENLQKLKNIMYSYVWENLNIGYIQGMCDLLMKRMSSNFPHGTAMDQHFSNMKTLIQILDTDLFEHMHNRGDYTHFYFSYRWFLLDFKRELVYDDVFSVWETIWAAKYVNSAYFHLFIALALVETYRDIIIENNMDFTDIIKFFNEMAEKHNISEILELARNLVKQLQNLIDNKNDINICGPLIRLLSPQMLSG
ncbi:unnamed protein product [Brachionus calyciflorus]|uniref:Rab-GAP TBC domain-containing protein n=1 Tax=Brachionus calyciflorus TaxID=104777 RepID=A0A814AXR8_9BILA|nr:unnamed protein product [Brachionus calyciflorus]